MSNFNPKSSTNALFPKPIECGYGVEVYPLTLAHYALLEKINSYLVNGDHEPDTIEVIQTYYICTHDAKDLINDFDNLKNNSFEWASGLPPSVSLAISNAVKTQIELMMKVLPVTDDGKKKVQVMDS